MAEWIEFETIDLGYEDPRTGTLLKSIEGRKNRPGIDPFIHRGTLLPDICRKDKRDKILSWYEKGNKLLLNINAIAKEAHDIVKDGKFKVKVLNDDQAKSLKEDFFGIKPLSPESGVTG